MIINVIKNSFEAWNRSRAFDRHDQAEFLRALAGPMTIGRSTFDICMHISQHGDTQIEKDLASDILEAIKGGMICDALEGWIEPISLTALRTTEQEGVEVFIAALEGTADALESEADSSSNIIKSAITPFVLLMVSIAIMIYPVEPTIRLLQSMFEGKSMPDIESLLKLIAFYKFGLWVCFFGLFNLFIYYRWYAANVISPLRMKLEKFGLFSSYRLSVGVRFISTYSLLKSFGIAGHVIFNTLRSTGTGYQRYHAELANRNSQASVPSDIHALDTGLLDPKHIALLHLYANADESKLILAMNKVTKRIQGYLTKKNAITAKIITHTISAWVFFNIIKMVIAVVGFNSNDYI